MRKLHATLLALALAATACGGSAPQDPADDGIAALDESREKDAPGASGKGTKTGGTDKKRDVQAGGGKKPAGGATPAPAGGGGGSGPDEGGSGGGGGPAPGAQAVPVPVPQGEYSFATDGQRTISGNTSDLPKTTTLTAGAAQDGVQRQTRDLRDSDGNGTLTETDLAYRPDGVYLSYVKVTSRFQGGLTDVREFRLARPQLVAPAGGGPGFQRAFTMQGSGTRARVTITAHRWENVTVAGRQLRALLVETDIRFSGALEGYQRTLAWFWPKHLLTLKEQVQTDVTNGPIRLQSSYRAQIQRV